jgi:hypothetical protein
MKWISRLLMLIVLGLACICLQGAEGPVRLLFVCYNLALLLRWGCTSPVIGRLRNFIGINPGFDIGTTVCRRTSDMKRSVLSGRIDYFDSPTTDEFLASPANPLVVQGSPLP